MALPASIQMPAKSSNKRRAQSAVTVKLSELCSIALWNPMDMPISAYATLSRFEGLLLDTVNRITTAATVDVVVIEDHPLYVEALLSLLSVALSGRKIERFRDIESAEPLLRVASPTVILLDLMLPGLRGTDALRRVRQQCPDAVMVTISGADDPVQVSACFAAGAQAFVSKAAKPQDIASVVRAAVEGRLVPPVWISSGGPQDPKALNQVNLTDRQMEVLQLMCLGHSNKHISGVLGITEQTTKAHAWRIQSNPGCANCQAERHG
ncbi:MAG: DNA-binding response regulator [Betaproteobacteria bacterium]|nr:DNA-binding response regulator [Betaproteobacteria bacterium]